VSFGSQEQFIKGYIDAIFFTDGEAREDVPISDTFVATRIYNDCKAFLDDAVVEIAFVTAMNPEYTPEQAGHDFWLTRNRHGVGFWDRDLGTLGELLTEKAHKFGSVGTYVDNGLLYYE
jgi:hypothetical protein